VRGRLALAAAGIIVALLVAEVSLRLLNRLQCYEFSSTVLWQPHAYYGWGHIPRAAGWVKRCLGRRVEWTRYVRINSRGLRDREIPYERTDAYRILLLGDSYTEGVQVEEQDMVSRRLEAALAAGPAGRRPIEVVNAGHAAYGTDNELLFYRHEGRKYRPDLVLLLFTTENDVLENYTPILRSIPFYYGDKPYFVFEGGRLVLKNFPLAETRGGNRFLTGGGQVLNRYSVLYRFLRTHGLPLVRAAAAADPPTFPPGPLGALLRRYPPEWNEAWRVTRALVRRLRRAVERDGARFAVAVVSGGYEVAPQRWKTRLYLAKQRPMYYDQDKAYRLITRFLRRRRIPSIPLRDAFREQLRVTGKDGYYPRDPHWDAAGHGLAAEVIARELVALGLVPDASRAGAPHHPAVR
jgi:hypothetical protein